MARILVVEDEEHLAKGLQFNLEAEDYEVDTLPDGLSASESLTRLEPAYDLVILDLMLPYMSGFEVVRRARAAGNYAPILILTAKDAPQDLMRGLEEGSLDGVAETVLKLATASGPGMEAGRKAILDTIRAAATCTLQEALEIQARHSGGFMTGDACRQGVIGTAWKKTVQV